MEASSGAGLVDPRASGGDKVLMPFFFLLGRGRYFQLYLSYAVDAVPLSTTSSNIQYYAEL